MIQSGDATADQMYTAPSLDDPLCILCVALPVVRSSRIAPIFRCRSARPSQSAWKSLLKTGQKAQSFARNRDLLQQVIKLIYRGLVARMELISGEPRPSQSVMLFDLHGQDVR